MSFNMLSTTGKMFINFNHSTEPHFRRYEPSLLIILLIRYKIAKLKIVIIAFKKVIFEYWTTETAT